MPNDQEHERTLRDRWDRVGDWSLIKAVVHRGRYIKWFKGEREGQWYCARVTGNRIDWVNGVSREP